MKTKTVCFIYKFYVHSDHMHMMRLETHFVKNTNGNLSVLCNKLLCKNLDSFVSLVSLVS